MGNWGSGAFFCRLVVFKAPDPFFQPARFLLEQGRDRSMTSPETETDQPIQDAEEKPELTLDVKVDKPSACQRHVTVTVSRADVDRYLDEAYSELMPTANVPGFRAGRAPRKLVEQRFKESVSEQVKGSLLMDSMTQITESHDFSAISEPDFDFDAVEIPDEGPLTFEFDIEVRPEFDMPQWKGLKLERLTREFTKKDVDRQLQQMLSRVGQLVPIAEPARSDDFVVVNIKCRHEGQVISTVEEQTVQIRPVLSFQDGRVEQFDKLMEGVQAGDHKSATVTISHDAAIERLQGQPVTVDFEVLEVKRLELPELNEDLLSNLGSFDNEGELRDAVKSSLERRLEYQRQRRIRQQITALLTEAANWDLPPDLLKRQSRRELERATMELRSAGFDEEEIKAYENELRQNSLASTKTALHEHFILERIAEEEKLDVEPQDYETELALIAAQSNEPIRRIRARFEKRGLMDALRNQIIERKVIELITANATFKEVKYQPETNETVALSHALCGSLESEIPEAKHGGDVETLQTPVDRT